MGKICGITEEAIYAHVEEEPKSKESPLQEITKQLNKK